MVYQGPLYETPLLQTKHQNFAFHVYTIILIRTDWLVRAFRPREPVLPEHDGGGLLQRHHHRQGSGKANLDGLYCWYINETHLLIIRTTLRMDWPWPAGKTMPYSASQPSSTSFWPTPSPSRNRTGKWFSPTTNWLPQWFSWPPALSIWSYLPQSGHKLFSSSCLHQIHTSGKNSL